MGGKLLLSLVVGTVIIILAAFSFLSGAILGAFLSYSADLPNIPELKRYQPKTVSTFYAEDGTVIGVFYKQKRFLVELNRIPVRVIHAFMAAEDSRFYQHRGVDWMGMLRAAYTNLVTGRFQQGASTITQQLTRHVLLSHDKKISRKIKEILLAKRLEKLWGKEKILYVYLNEIYLGGQCYGVEAAARNYFDKHVEQLTTAEAALLAGIVPSPATYNPFENREKALR